MKAKNPLRMALMIFCSWLVLETVVFFWLVKQFGWLVVLFIALFATLMGIKILRRLGANFLGVAMMLLSGRSTGGWPVLMQQNQLVAHSLTAAAGLCLIMPGFLSDIIGLILLTPGFRLSADSYCARRFSTRVNGVVDLDPTDWTRLDADLLRRP